VNDRAGDVHQVDTDLAKSGRLMLGVGGVLSVAGAAVALVVGEPAIAPLPVSAGVASLAYGVNLVRSPTAGADVTVDADAVTIRQRTLIFRVPWSDVDHWGVGTRKAFGARSRFTQLLLWPVSSPDPATVAAARRLWKDHHHAWAVTTFDPPAALLADLDRIAPKPRRDAITESDW
jgi:hypothetical protein